MPAKYGPLKAHLNPRESVLDTITLRGGPCAGEERQVSVDTRSIGVQGPPVKSRHLAVYDQLPDDPRTFRFVGLKPVRMGP